MQVTIDHYGGYYRWKLTIGDGRGNTFAEGKSGSFGGAREIAYSVVAVFCRGAEGSKPGSLAFKMLWERVEWFESPAAKAHSQADIERDIRIAFAVGDARRKRGHNVKLTGAREGATTK